VLCKHLQYLYTTISGSQDTYILNLLAYLIDFNKRQKNVGTKYI
jgi:hypothetical protein